MKTSTASTTSTTTVPLLSRSLPPPLSALAALLLASACATSQHPRTARGNEIEFPADEALPKALDRELEGKNDEELFAVGTAAYQAGDYGRAAAAFARLADVFPGSRHAAWALMQSGLAYERVDEWRLALERFRALEREQDGADAVEASFRVAECHYHLRELGDAHATLDALVRRTDLAAADRVRALAQLGIVTLEEGRPEEAETALRQAVSTYQAASEQERLDSYYAAQAQYYLGEIYRDGFAALPVDPSRGDDETLQRDLEHKAELLLSAQGHYLRAIRMGNDRWAVASGLRIGELYDALRTELLDAPLPPGLDAEHAASYRAELRRRVRVLAAKAVTAYEQTLSRAARSSVDDPRFLSEAEGALDRLKAALADDAQSPAM